LNRWAKRRLNNKTIARRSNLSAQNSIFSYVQRNNNSEGVDGNEQCSSNVKEAPNPNRTKCSLIAKV